MTTTKEAALFVSPWCGALHPQTSLRVSKPQSKTFIPLSYPTRRAKIVTLSAASNTNPSSLTSTTISNAATNINSSREPKPTTQLNATSSSTASTSTSPISMDDNVQLVHSMLTFVSTRVFPKSTYETIQSIEDFLDPEVSWKNPAFKVHNVSQAASQLKRFTSFFGDARFEYHEITTLTNSNEQNTTKNVNIVFCNWTLSGTWPLFWKRLVVTGKSKVHIENGKIKTIRDSFKWGGKQV